MIEMRIMSCIKRVLMLTVMLLTDGGDRTIPVGGQAVIEGVLMRGPDHWGLVVREPDGAMWRKAWLGSEWLKRGVWRLPIVRGFANMVEMMRIGTRAITLSAGKALGEEEEMTFFDAAVSVIMGILMVAGLFIALPVWLADKSAAAVGAPAVGRHVMEGVYRCCVFIAYIALAGLVKDIRRVFGYHGAEHKTINAFEQGLPIGAEHAAGCSRIHRRCGTSFLVIVAAVSILVFSVFSGGPLWIRIVGRIALLPLVTGISYEIIKAASRGGMLCSALVTPALALQYLTTREPDSSMLEVASASLETALDPTAALSGIEEGSGSFEEVKGDTDGYNS